MSKLDQFYDNKIIQNLFVWIMVFIIFAGAGNENGLISALVIIAFLIPPIYINNIYILPYLKRNPIQFSLLFALNAMAFSAIIIFILSQFFDESISARMINLFGLIVLAIIFGAALKLARDSFQRRQQEKEMELKLLKGQLNPHFLFNTLNNLYGLSVAKSDKLPPLMLKLSELLRYSLYETKDALVSLNKELEYLENYIALESIRLDDKVKITVNKDLPSTISTYKIAPMLLIIYIENAFKHLDTIHQESALVNINISMDENKLIFNCENSTDIATKTPREMTNSGIGLSNVQKRLNLIYPDRHEYQVSNNNNIFKVSLKIELG